MTTTAQNNKIKEMNTLRQKVTEHEERVHNLQDIISKTEEIISLSQITNNSEQASLIEKKENLLANIACGELVDEEILVTLDDQIESEDKKRATLVDAANEASVALAGLQRKLKEEQNEFAIAKSCHIDAFAYFIENEIEVTGREYAELAKVLSDKFMKLMALAEISEINGAAIDIYGPYTADFQIPSVKINSCISEESGEHPGFLFRNFLASKPQALKNEQQRLRSIGVVL